MSFYEDVARAKLLLGEQGWVSVKGLMRELGLDQAGLEDLIEELVDAQGVALRTGNVLVSTGHRSTATMTAVTHIAAVIVSVARFSDRTTHSDRSGYACLCQAAA